MSLFGILDVPKMMLAAVIGALISAAYVGPTQYAKGRAAGKAVMVEAVTKQNTTAAKAAREAKNAVDACDEAGGTWSQETGKCVLQ